MANESAIPNVLSFMRTPDRQPTSSGPARGLMVREPWASLILAGKKSWEIRGTRTTTRGPIYIIPSGSGRVVGCCEIVDVLGPLTLDEMIANTDAHLTLADELHLTGLPYKNTFAWVVSNPQRFATPVSYKHPSGAITWVDLEELREELACQRGSAWQLTGHSASS